MTKALTLKDRVASVRNMLEAKKGEIAAVLPSHCTADRMVQVALAACVKTPKLLECTQASLLLALKQASELGLEFNGVLGHAALIPYGNEAVFQPMYKGLLDLAYRSGRVTKADGHIVRENDEFRYNFGLRPDLHHIPARNNRGAAIGAYVIAHIKDLEPVFDYMTKEEIEEHRNKYSRAWRKRDSAWQTAPDPMWLKTVFIQLARWLPKSIEMVNIEKAIQYDYKAETGADIGGIDFPHHIDTTAEEVDPLDAAAADMEREVEESEGLDELREEVARLSQGMPDEVWRGFLAQAGADGVEIGRLTKSQLEAVKTAIINA